MEGGSVADWVSGIGSMLAVFVALFGYFLVEWQRRKDAREKLQGQIYQIGFKLSTLASEAHVMMKSLNPRGLPLDELLQEADPMVICGSQPPVIGHDTSMVRDLTDAEQNLLMGNRDEGFLMDFSECVAGNDSIRTAMVDYARRREEMLAVLPPPEQMNDNVGSVFLTQEQMAQVLPRIIPAGQSVMIARQMAKENVDMVNGLCARFEGMMLASHPKLHVHKIEIDLDKSAVGAAGAQAQ